MNILDKIKNEGRNEGRKFRDKTSTFAQKHVQKITKVER